MFGGPSSRSLPATTSAGVFLAGTAHTVLSMFAAGIGVVVGLLVAVGPLGMVRDPTRRISDTIVASVSDALSWVLGHLPYADEHPKVVTVLAVLAAVTTPGIAALVLVWASGAAQTVRNALGVIVSLASLGSFLVLEPSQAGTLVIAALAAVVLLLTPVIFVARAGLWALATVIASAHLVQLWNGQAPPIAEGAQILASMTQLAPIEFWRLALIGVGISPFVCATAAATR